MRRYKREPLMSTKGSRKGPRLEEEDNNKRKNERRRMATDRIVAAIIALEIDKPLRRGGRKKRKLPSNLGDRQAPLPAALDTEDQPTLSKRVRRKGKETATRANSPQGLVETVDQVPLPAASETDKPAIQRRGRKRKRLPPNRIPLIQFIRNWIMSSKVLSQRRVDSLCLI